MKRRQSAKPLHLTVGRVMSTGLRMENSPHRRTAPPHRMSNRVHGSKGKMQPNLPNHSTSLWVEPCPQAQGRNSVCPAEPLDHTAGLRRVDRPKNEMQPAPQNSSTSPRAVSTGPRTKLSMPRRTSRPHFGFEACPQAQERNAARPTELLHFTCGRVHRRQDKALIFGR